LIHSKGLVHRDLKPENLMVTLLRKLKIGDFGGTKDQAGLEEKGQTGLFSKYWADMMAREKKYSMESEVYAFGLNVYYIIFAKPLYSKDDEHAYLENKHGLGGKEFNEAMNEAEFLLIDTIKACLDDDPTQRPTFATLEKSIFNRCISTFCKQKKDGFDVKALELI